MKRFMVEVEQTGIEPTADANGSNASADSTSTNASACTSDNAEIADPNEKDKGATAADPKCLKEPRRVFNEPPFSSHTHFKVKIEVTAHLEGYHHNDNPELTAEEIQEKLASGEMVISECSLSFGGTNIISKEKRKTKTTRFEDLRDALFKVISIEPIEDVPENWKEAQEFFRNWKTKQ